MVKIMQENNLGNVGIKVILCWKQCCEMMWVKLSWVKVTKGKEKDQREEGEQEEEGGDKMGSRPLIPAAAAVL